MSKNILIVDDNASVRQSLRNLLEDVGNWRVCGEAVNGRDALEKAQRLQPDLVVLDFSMPVMNGLDAACLLKNLRPALPVLMLTAFKDKFLEEQAMSAGASGVVSKADDTKVLLDYVRILLKYGTTSADQEN